MSNRRHRRPAPGARRPAQPALPTGAIELTPLHPTSARPGPTLADYRAARRAHPAPPQEEAMPTFTEDDHPVPYAPHVGGVTQLQQTVASLIGRLRSAEDELTQQADQIDRLVIDNRQTIELVQRVEALEAKAHRRKTPGPRALDATNQAIVDYLTVEVPGVWLTPMAIAANMGDAVSHRAVAANMGDAVSHRAVAARLVRLSRDGHVERRGGYTSGANPLYRVTPKQQPETGAQS